MCALLRGFVSFVLIGVGLATVWAEPAVAAATTTVGTTEVGVGAYAGTDDVADYHKVTNHNGNVSVTSTDSDTGPDGSASGDRHDLQHGQRDQGDGHRHGLHEPELERVAVDLYPAVVYLDTVLGESGQWVYEGSFDTTASDTTYDACIGGSVRLAIYPPGEDDVPDHNELAQVTSC